MTDGSATCCLDCSRLDLLPDENDEQLLQGEVVRSHTLETMDVVAVSLAAEECIGTDAPESLDVDSTHDMFQHVIDNVNITQRRRKK